MHIAFAFVLIGTAVFAAQADPSTFRDEANAHHWRLLDKSERARVYASWYTIPVTDGQFRKMQQQYRPRAFDMWAKRLRQLRPGMTEKQVIAILRPKEVGPQLIQNPGFSDTMVLDGAYFSDVFFSEWPHRMTSATTPLARTYEIRPNQKKPPKT
jgi:hypothetical protein